MTEYWVSQGQKWCEYCHIFLADNAQSWRMHEGGERHKAAVARKLAELRKANAAQEVEKRQTERALQQIEEAATRQYRRDLAAQQQAEQAQQPRPPDGNVAGDGWVPQEGTSYLFNTATGYFYDPDSGLYYNEKIGRWTTQEDAARASEGASGGQPKARHAVPAPQAAQPSRAAPAAAAPQARKVPTSQPSGAHGQAGAVPGAPRAAASGLPQATKGGAVPSSLEVSKRKRDKVSSSTPSAEEAAALAARKAARQRTQEREQKHLGLYQSF